MKSASANESPTKSTSGKITKKSRPKVTKFTKQTNDSQQPSDSAKNSPSGDSNRGKSHQRGFSGFGPKSIKVFWEQYDTSDTDVTPEAYAHLADDVTYKVWDMINIIKTYGRHSGGRVTCDIINEVLKDSDAPPIMGFVNKPWDRIEYDGNFYFKADEDVDLREEYLAAKDFNELPLSGVVSATWCIDDQNAKTLREFSSHLCSAIFLGDGETYNYALQVASSNPHTGSIFKILIKKCIEMLVFDQTETIIERCMRFIRALARNFYTHDTDCREQFSQLAELFASLLFGPQLPEKRGEYPNNCLNAATKIDLNKETVDLNLIDSDDIRNACEVLFQMMSEDGFQDRDSAADCDIKMEQDEKTGQLKTDDVNVEESPGTTETEEVPRRTKYSVYRTCMVSDHRVESVYLALGDLSSYFGYFQNECAYLFREWMEIFIKNRQPFDASDYKLLSRIVKGLIILGEVPFKEISPYLRQLDLHVVPDSLTNVFNLSAVFIRGRDDIFLYEWLEAFCGNMLQPFMLHLHRKVLHKLSIRSTDTKTTLSVNKIFPKVTIKSSDIWMNDAQLYNIAFTDVSQNLSKDIKRIQFRFSGCRPLQLKPKQPESSAADKSFSQVPLNKLYRKTIICKRKLLKPLPKKRSLAPFPDYCFRQI